LDKDAELYMSEEVYDPDPDEISDEVLLEQAFIGTYPYDVIFQSITDQAINYIITEDREDYSSIFISQMSVSMRYFDTEVVDSSTILRERKKDLLLGLQEKYVMLLFSLLKSIFGVVHIAIDDGEINYEEQKDILDKLYDFFIVNARKNIKNAIVQDSLRIIKEGDLEGVLPATDDECTQAITNILDHNYSPRITAMTCEQYLKYNEADDILSLYESGVINGNFLNVYATSLYTNEDFMREIIADIIIEYDSQ